MNYFEGLTEESEIKAKYKELAKQYHPDLGGDKVIMQNINLQYEEVLRGKYQREGKSLSEVDEILEKDYVIRGKMNEILSLEGLNIELCGCWLWITGNTKNHKEKLKNIGFLWSHTKKAWYWRSEIKKCRFKYKHTENDLDSIRYKYGTEKIRKDNNIKIA